MVTHEILVLALEVRILPSQPAPTSVARQNEHSLDRRPEKGVIQGDEPEANSEDRTEDRVRIRGTLTP